MRSPLIACLLIAQCSLISAQSSVNLNQFAPLGASSNSKVNWASVAAANNAAGQGSNQQNDVNVAILVPEIGAAATQFLSTSTVGAFAACQNFIHSLAGLSNSSSSVTGYIQQLAGLNSSPNVTAQTMNEFISFIQQTAGATNASSALLQFDNYVQTLAGPNIVVKNSLTLMNHQIHTAILDSSNLLLSTTAYSMYLESLVGASATKINSTQGLLAYSGYIKNLIGASVVQANSSNSFIEFLTISATAGPSTTNQTLNEFVAFVQQSVGPSNSKASLKALNTFNTYLVRRAGATNTTNIIDFVQSPVGPSNATNLIAFINANAGTNNVSLLVTFVQQNSGVSNISTVIDYINGAVGPQNASSFITFIQSNAGVNNVTELVAYINNNAGAQNVTSLLSYISQPSGPSNVTALLNYIAQNSGTFNINGLTNYIIQHSGLSGIFKVLNYIANSGAGSSNVTSILNFITSNAGMNNVTDVDLFINFVIQNYGPSSTSSLIYFNNFIQAMVGSNGQGGDLSNFAPLLSSLSSQGIPLSSNSNIIQLMEALLATQGQPIPLKFTKNANTDYWGQYSFQWNVVYYGNQWTDIIQDEDKIYSFLTSFQDSTWWKIAFQYFNDEQFWTFEGQPKFYSHYMRSSIVSSTSLSQYYIGSALNNSNNDLIKVIDNLMNDAQANFQSPLDHSDVAYLFLTSPEVSVVDKQLGTLWVNFNGFHTSTRAILEDGTTYDLVWGMVGKPQISNMKAQGFTNIDASPNNSPQIDFVIYVLAHEIFEIFTDANVGGGYFSTSTNDEVVDVCQNHHVSQGTTYFDANGKSFVANIVMGGRKYLLPAVWSPISNLCTVSPLVPTIACSAVPEAARIQCGSPKITLTEDICNANSCCWDNSSKTCFYSSSAVTPATCPFILPLNRIDCQASSASACEAKGCCWSDSQSGVHNGPSCFRPDVLVESGPLVAEKVVQFIPLSNRLGTNAGAVQDCHLMQEMNSALGYDVKDSYFIWQPVIGLKNNISCYFNSYASNNVGYSYRNEQTNTKITCSGITTTTSTMLPNFKTASDCLANNGCWQPINFSVEFSPLACYSAFSSIVGGQLGPIPELSNNRNSVLAASGYFSIYHANGKYWCASTFTSTTGLSEIGLHLCSPGESTPLIFQASTTENKLPGNYVTLKVVNLGGHLTSMGDQISYTVTTNSLDPQFYANSFFLQSDGSYLIFSASSWSGGLFGFNSISNRFQHVGLPEATKWNIVSVASAVNQWSPTPYFKIKANSFTQGGQSIFFYNHQCVMNTEWTLVDLCPTSTGWEDQIFTFGHNIAGKYDYNENAGSIVLLGTKNCLSVNYNQFVGVGECNWSSNQQWGFDAANGTLKNIGLNLCVTVVQPTSEQCGLDKEPLKLTACTGATNQQISLQDYTNPVHCSCSAETCNGS